MMQLERPRTSNIEVRKLELTDAAGRIPSDQTALAEQWERLVKHNPASGFMQSPAWAQMKRKQGLSTLHLGLFENDTLCGGVILYSASDPSRAGILVAPQGPVLDWTDEASWQEQLSVLLAAIKVEAKKLNAVAVRIEPRLPALETRLLQDFGPAPVDLLPRETLYLDLNPTEEEILSQMKPKGRYNIRIARKHGVEIEIYAPSHDTTSSNDNTAALTSAFDLYEVLEQASLRDKFLLEPEPFFINLVENLCPTGIAEVLFAKHEGETLGTLLLIKYGPIATYLYGGITNDNRHLMAGYLLQWTAITRARQAGCQIYDFYGYNQFQTPGHPYARFSQFKSKFGGMPQRFVGGLDHYFTENLADAVIRAIKEAL